MSVNADAHIPSFDLQYNQLQPPHVHTAGRSSSHLAIMAHPKVLSVASRPLGPSC